MFRADLPSEAGAPEKEVIDVVKHVLTWCITHYGVIDVVPEW